MHSKRPAFGNALDLIVLDRCGALLRLRAAISGVLLYVEDRGVLDGFIQDALVAYEDFQYFRREYRQRLEQRLAEGLSVAGRKMDQGRVEVYLSQLDEAVPGWGKGGVGGVAVIRRRGLRAKTAFSDARIAL